MKKQTLLNFIAHFEKELNGLIQSAKAAHLAATHEESRAEDRHDTFAIESSYLAAGQAERVKDLRRTLAELNQCLQSSTASPETVDIGVILLTECEGRKTYSLMLKSGGGAHVQVDGKTVSLLSPASPLGEHAFGLIKGESFTMEARNGIKEIIIVDLL